MSWLSRFFGKTEKTRHVILAHTRGYTHEIVGEAHYQDTILKIAGPKTEDSVNYECLAVLQCDDKNPYDANAVAVRIDNSLVGYLARKDAQTYRDELRSLDSSMPFAQVRAKIVGGWKSSEDEGHFGVKLNLRRPLQLAESD